MNRVWELRKEKWFQVLQFAITILRRRRADDTVLKASMIENKLPLVVDCDGRYMFVMTQLIGEAI